MWAPRVKQPLTAALKMSIDPLLDKPKVAARFGLDFYLEMPAADKVFHRKAYWSGVFGFCHDRSVAKGFVEIVI